MKNVETGVAEVRSRIVEVRSRIMDACRRAGRPPDAVELVAVSKKQPMERVLEAYAAGQRHFAENYVQALEQRRASMPTDVHWHLIGHLQTNKVRRAVGLHLIHSVDSARLGRALNEAASARRVCFDVLVEVNLAGEPSKTGVQVAGVEALLLELAGLEWVRPVGLMCIPPEEQGRRHFAELRSLRDALRRVTGLELPHLSMGMSGDYEDAILEGATIVRVGTSIFGPREG